MRRCPHLILGSSSPRRRELLAAAGWTFDVIAPDIEEIPRPDESPETFARRAASDKARAVVARLPPRRRGGAPRVVIGCDTVVALDRRILGKPRDAAEARRMLKTLSGRRHRVISGLCVLTEHPRGWRAASRVVTTQVAFRRLRAAEIVRYVATGEPMDKAGAYAIQGGAAGMVREVRGCYTNVVGFPMTEVLDLIGPPPRA